MNMLLRDFPSPATQMPFAVEAEAAGTDLINRMTETTRVRRGNLVLVMEDAEPLAAQVDAICGYVGMNVEAAPCTADLAMLLEERRPLAVIAPFETRHQDGGHILKAIALYDRDLPVMLLAGRNAIYQGAAEAMREILGLSMLSLPFGPPSLGQIVEFLAGAAQRSSRRRRAQADGAGLDDDAVAGK